MKHSIISVHERSRLGFLGVKSLRLIGIACLLGLAFGVNVALAQTSELSESAKSQIQALIAEKEARTPTQQKIDSQLIYAAKGFNRQPIAQGVPTLETGVEIDERGEVAIEIRAPYSTSLAKKLLTLGVSVIRHNDVAQSIEALAPIVTIEEIAAEPNVRFVMPQLRGMIAGGGELKLTPRLSRFKAKVIEALAAHETAQAKIGSANSQGDAAHRAAETRTRFGVNGAGLRIGVLSDSFNNLGAAATDVTNGDLPGATNPNGFLTPVRFAGSGDLASGGSDEGRAMLQIVHDIAPGAQLYFAEAFSSFANFAENIRALRGISASPGAFGNVSPGCDIIIDDIFYFVETGLHDGQPAASNQNMALVTQAVNDVTANGALYFSSAGNSGSVQQGTSGAWEGNFVTGTRPAIITGTGDALAWNGVDVGNTLTGTNSVTMQWSDPLGGSSNDYDLFRLNSTLTTVVTSSTNVQTGTQDPFEIITGASSTRLVVVRRTGAAIRFISLSTNRSRLQYATNGQTRGHGASPNAFGVAATPAAASGGAPTPTGPSPGAFVGTNQIENFSSDGPRRSFFNSAGVAYTPGLFLAANGILRQKPDFTAADGVATTLPGASGLNPFYGTSAAAPHAGAIAALVKQGAPLSTNSQITTFLTSTALDIMSAGSDAGSGVGILQAFQAVAATGAVPRAVLTLNTVTLPTGNGVIEPSDCNVINISLNNTSQVGATGITATLTSSTPGITITQGFSSYPNLNAASGASNTTPFQVSSAPGLVGGTVVNFTLTVNYSGGTSPQVFTFTRTAGGAQNYAFTPTTGATIPSGGTIFTGSNVDDAAFTFTSPFAITAYGNLLGTTVAVDTNGTVAITGAAASVFTNTALPAATLPAGVAYSVYWDDLDLNVTGGGIIARVFGVTPTRQLIIEWRGETISTAGAAITTNVALVLNEGSSVFEYRYVTVGGNSAGGASATIGVQDSVSGRFTQFSFNTSSVIAGRVLTGNLVAGASGTGICPASTTAITSIVPAGNQTVGVPYTVNVSVTGASPTGTVLSRDDAGDSCTVTLPASSCLLTSATPGLRTITARYSGDANNSGSSATTTTTVVENRRGLQVGTVTLPATTTSNSIIRVNFAQAFNIAPVVIVQPSNADADPQAVRIFNVTRTGFNALQVEAPGGFCAGCTGTGSAMNVHWLAATRGSYFLQATAMRGSGGILVKVGTVTINNNQHGAGGFTGWPSTGFLPVSYPAPNTFLVPPVILSTLQTWAPANEGLNLNTSTPNLSGTSQVWATTVARNVTTSGFDIAIESSEVDDDDVGAPGLDGPETIGYVAIEGNTSGVVGQLGGGTVGLATNTATVTDACTDVDVTMPGTITVVGANLRGFAGKQTRTEPDGGWLRRCAFASPGSSVARMGVRVDEDGDIDAERTHGAETIGAAIFSGDFSTTPITLARTSVQGSGDQLKVSFNTATEIGNLGFRIWGRANDGSDWTALHDDLIFSTGGDGMKSKSYARTVAAAGSSEIRIEDVDLLGRSRFSAAIAVGANVGTDAINAPINWTAIRAANALSPIRQIQTAGAKKLLLQVKTSGIQRVEFADLVAAGWSESNVAASEIAVLDGTTPVLRHVHCAGAMFGPGCSIEFLGVASDSLYGAVNSYAIGVGEKMAKPVARGALADGPAAVKTVRAQLQVAPNRAYSFSAPGNDPWFDERVLATTQPVSINRTFVLPERSAGTVSIDVDLWGGLDFSAPGPDHSVALSVNGLELRTLRFDGLTAQRVRLEVPENLISDSNTLTLKVNADTGLAADVVLLDGYTVNYQRLSNAASGELKFGSVSNSANGASDRIFGGDFEVRGGFAINGLNGPASVWTQIGSSVQRDEVNGDTVVDAHVTDLILAETSKLLRPTVVAATSASFNTTPVDYLIITHPLFEAELTPLIALQQGRGYSVRALRTDEIYAAKSDYAPSPQAIREVISQISPRFVLLVGGDSYDYKDYLGVGSQSYLPTFYHAADQIVRFAASDALFSDANGDGAPERALGRIPARTVAELRLAISSIVQRGNTPATRYLAVAGASNAAEHFDIHSRSLLSYLRQGQPKEFALADELGITEARAKAAAGLGGDADWINYLGHSSPNRWASQNLLDTSQLSAITRGGIPAVVSQWGCWNNYFVMPDQDTMAHALMLRSNRLASSVIGSTSLAEDASHMALGTRFFDLVEDGRIGDRDDKVINTLGEALMGAKADLARSNPENIESNYSITLFGDPAAVLR